MAAPNLKSPGSVAGKTQAYRMTTTLAAALENSAETGKLLRVSSIRASNLNSIAAIRVSVSHFRGSTHTYLVKDSEISPGKALVISDRNEPINVEEGDAIYASASSDNSGDLIISYDEFS